MEIPVQLKNDIVAYLTSLPNMMMMQTQQALVMGAGLDPQLLSQLNFGLPPAPFFQILLATFSSYGRLHDGREPIDALLQASRDYGGPDKQAICDRLIQDWTNVRGGKVSSTPSDNTRPNAAPATTSAPPSSETAAQPTTGNATIAITSESSSSEPDSRPMTGPTVFSWLHLTDFHCGMTRQSWLWPGVREIVFEDLKRLHDKCGPWDLVLFTGDLTQKGSAEEFQKADEILQELWEQLRTLGSDPQLLAVPGNHDLARPNSKHPTLKTLKNWQADDELQHDFFEADDTFYRPFIQEAFQHYTSWWNSSTLRPPTLPSGILPGDFAVTFEKNGAKLGIAGLNSSFLQLTADDYEGKLALHPAQFHAACNDDGVAWAKQHHACLFMTHHPPVWLTPQAQQHLYGEITAHNRFAVHLCGHMHANVYRTVSEGGSDPQRLWQGRSLFGLEYYDTDNTLERSHGYSVGRIELERDQGFLTFWPREDRKQGYQRSIVPDYSINLQDEQHTRPATFSLLRSYETVPGDHGGGDDHATISNQPIRLPSETTANREASVKILFLSANPIDTARLRLDAEVRAIDSALRQTVFRDRFELIKHGAVRFDELSGLLLRHKPTIVHFSGHGSKESEIKLEDDSGKAHTVPAGALATLFSILTENIRCVVLNACFSEKQATAIAQHIDCVIGMSDAIKDKTALNFATAFYQALGYGQDIKRAFDLGCVQVHMGDLQQQHVPQLFALHSHPENIVLVKDV